LKKPGLRLGCQHWFSDPSPFLQAFVTNRWTSPQKCYVLCGRFLRGPFPHGDSPHSS
jgi:hypothetical protein